MSEAYWVSNQSLLMKLSFANKPFPRKNSIIDVWQSSKYTSLIYKYSFKLKLTVNWIFPTMFTCDETFISSIFNDKYI